MSTEAQREAEQILMDAFKKVCALTGATKVKVAYKRFDLGPTKTGIECQLDTEYAYTKQKAKL